MNPEQSNNCPWPKCNKFIKYNGTSIIGMQVDGQWKAVHRSCFHNVSLKNAFANKVSGIEMNHKEAMEYKIKGVPNQDGTIALLPG